MSYTLKQLIGHYRTDPDSRFAKLSYDVRIKQDRLLKRIDRDYGHQQLRSIRARTLLAWFCAATNETGVPISLPLSSLFATRPEMVVTGSGRVKSS